MTFRGDYQAGAFFFRAGGKWLQQFVTELKHGARPPDLD